MIEEKWEFYPLRRLIHGCKIQTSAGTIEITNDVIATVVGGAATDVFGVVGMASKIKLKIILLRFCVKKITQEE